MPRSWSFERTEMLPATPDVAWRYVEEHGAELEPLRFEPAGPQAPGVRNRVTARVLGIPIRVESRTEVWQPPDRCVFESVRPARPVRARITETFERDPTGTRHVIRYDVTATGTPGRLVGPIVIRLMRRSRAEYQRRLRAGLAAAAHD